MVFGVDIAFILLSMLTNVENKTSSSALSSSSIVCAIMSTSSERIGSMGENWGESSITIGEPTGLSLDRQLSSSSRS